MVLQIGREVSGAVVTGYKIQPIGAGRMGRRIERRQVDRADRAGWQAGVKMRIIGRVVVQVGGRAAGTDGAVAHRNIGAQRRAGFEARQEDLSGLGLVGRFVDLLDND